MIAGHEMRCASHNDMTQHPTKTDFYVSDDDAEWNVYTRETAINGAHSLRIICDKTVFYIDLGWSSGMKSGLEFCKKNGIPFETRKLNYDNVLSLGAKLITFEFIDAIVKGQKYTKFLGGTLLRK
jgi:hypothetical protein